MNKKLLCAILGVALLTSSAMSAPALATTRNSPNIQEEEGLTESGNYYTGYCWDLDYISQNVRDIHQGSWNYLGSHTATRTGETYSVSCSTSYSHNFTGSLSIGTKEVQAQLGYTFGVSKSFQESITSAPLNAKCKVKAYWIQTYSQSDIHQKELYYVMKNGVYIILKPTGNTKIAYANKAIMPNFKFDYYDGGGNLSKTNTSEKLKPFKTEIYKADANGNYHLNEIINYANGN